MKTKMMKICSTLAGAAIVFAASNVSATILGTGDLTITAPGLSSGDVNGPYAVKTTSVISGANLGNFSTFCLGSQIDYYSGGQYSYQISTTVQPFASGTGGGLSYVTLGTAWLYSQFRAGAIGDGSVNDAVNDAIQAAIWYLQGGQAGGANNSFVTLAMNAVGAANYLTDANGAFGVYALNMSPINGTGLAPGDAYNYAQPELCIVPEQRIPAVVPEASTMIAGGLLLLPLGVSVVRILRKHRAAIANR